MYKMHKGHKEVQSAREKKKGGSQKNIIIAALRTDGSLVVATSAIEAQRHGKHGISSVSAHQYIDRRDVFFFQKECHISHLISFSN